MKGGLPAALLCAAFGFALAFAPRRLFVPALVLLVLAALAGAALPIATAWRSAAFLTCWAAVVITAAAVHLPGGVGRRLIFALAVLDGLVVGSVIAVAGQGPDLVKALPVALLCWPGAWLVARRGGIAVKVAASWLIAVSILAASLPATTKTPGYAPDHMD